MAKQRHHHVGHMRVGALAAAAGLGRIVPADVVADQQVVRVPRLQGPQDQALDLLVGVAGDVVVFGPGAARHRRVVKAEVGRLLGMNPDEAARRVALVLDDVHRLQRDPAAHGVAADCAAGGSGGVIISQNRTNRASIAAVT
ncbi:hypothetical protein [Phreatobacter sp.]|uniref:hypothetical protein n=1 Tax=Phreatobacter sp. TaxID=1966341 RepID=UPI0025FA2E0F|nr:hypothetical protein [Phreatobacter sp.]